MFADKLKEKRNQLGLTQSELADRLHVSRSLVAKWEQGRALPTKSSLNDMRVLFACEEKDLLDYGDVDKTLANNKKSYRNSLIIIGVVGAIALSAIGVGIYLGVKNSNNHDDNAYDLKTNVSFSDSLLKSSGLSSIPMIPKNSGSDSYLATFGSSSEQYIATIDNRDVFTSYMNELYLYFRGDPYISSLSSSINHPEDHWRDPLTGRFSQNFNSYLLPMNDLSEFSSFPFENGDLGVKYSFYYLKDVPSSHKAHESVDPYEASVEYYASPSNLVGIKKNGESDFTFAYGNFSLSITHLASSHYSKSVIWSSGDPSSKIDYDAFNYYLCQEFYDIKRMTITKDNYETYLPIEERNDDAGKSLWLSSSGPFSPAYRLDASIDYAYSVDGISVSETEAFSFGVGYPFHGFAFSRDDAHSYSNITLSNLQIKGGYFYELTRKEGAPDPYPDRNYYLS